MGTLRKISLAQDTDFKTSIPEQPRRQGPGLDGHLLFSFVLIIHEKISNQKRAHFLELLF